MPIKTLKPEETRKLLEQREDSSFVSFLPRKRNKVKVTHLCKLPPDDPIYTSGIVIGGSSLKKPEDNK